jgi:UDP-N-acetyl-D-mannosaminuronic acid dehydrogenase
MKRVSILGLGYIGLPIAIIAAEGGYDVAGFDTNEEKIKKIVSGDPIILEPEIAERLLHSFRKKNLNIGMNLEYADCFIITVPTPFKKNKKADLQYVWQAGKTIAQRLMPGNLIIVESTIPVGTTEKLGFFIEEETGLKLGVDFFIAHCPERAIPGNLFKELLENDRVIGGYCQKSCELAYQFYSKFVKGFLYSTDDKSAEMVKLVENSFRDVEIAFANQVASMCSQTGVDPYHIIKLANKHPRVNILSPSCGVGGHCIPVDPWFLIETFPQKTKLLRIARDINDQKPSYIVNKVLFQVEELRNITKKKPKILILGLTFKPNVDDLRESPALKIAQELTQKNDLLDLIAYEPHINKELERELGVFLCINLRQEVLRADIVVILVKHKKFMRLTEDLFCNKIVLDSCGLLYDMQRQQSKLLLSGATRVGCNFENVSF